MAEHARAAGPDTPAIDAEAFRAAVRRAALPVAIVAADDGGVREGLTTTTLCAAGSDPPALVVGVGNDTALARAIARSRAFSVNLLGEDQYATGRAFSAPDCPGDRFADGPWHAGPTGSPVLADALCSFDCAVAQTLTLGRQTVFVGQVIALAGREADPLLYRDGYFRRLAPT